MGVFHQMGHHSINLVHEPHLSMYEGMICSPLNYTQGETSEQIRLLPGTFHTILDPQMYFPRSERGKLHTWDYFPSDFDSVDQTNIKWWQNICNKLVSTCERIGCTDVCSPCVVPGRFTIEYYDFFVQISNYLFDQLASKRIEVYQTAIVDLNSIGDEKQAELIASVLSKTNSNVIYLIIKSDVEPRRELCNSAQLLGIMKLIHLLETSGLKVFVGFCSSEILLWKYAGASKFSTGKFFNLRRFTSSRFDEPSGGGGQLPYWFELNLMAYLREGDILRLQNENLLHPDCLGNPYSIEILDTIKNEPGKAWLGLSWKNYLYNFAEIDRTIVDRKVINQILITAETNWSHLDDIGILMEEIRNTGAWIRPWRIAINDFNRYVSQ